MKLTLRLANLKERLFNEEFKDKGTWHFKNVSILTDEETKREPLVVRKARAIEYIANNLPAYIKRDELIVGNPNQNSVACGVTMPTYATEEELANAKKYVLDQNSVWGHHPPDWNKIITKGISGIKEEINEAIEREWLKTEPREEALYEYRAMIISLDAVVKFAHRHAEVALKESLKETDPIRKRELYGIYKVCNKVPEQPAQTYQEALQGYWFTYCILNSGGEFIPFGCGDRYLYPCYKKDILNQKITKEHAIDLTGSFLVKCNERVIVNIRDAENHNTFGLFSQGVLPEDRNATAITGGYDTGGYDQKALLWKDDENKNSDSNFNYGQSGNDWLMNFVVGGRNRDGSDGTNELSYLILDLMDEMKLLMPTLAVRIHKDSPQEFVGKIAEVLRYGRGEPAIYNDDAIIPGFVDMGIPVEDAREYSNDGCWETLIPGKSHFSYAHVQNLQCLEWVLTRGESLLKNNLKEGLDTGDPLKFENWDEFYEAYKKQVYSKIDFQCERRINNLGMSYMIAPDPLMSALMDDCIETGKDVSQDGARYIFHLILITGLADTADSLAVIKKLVYEEKRVKMEELIDGVRNNWKGYEKLRATVINKVPKFGNDNDFVDDIAVKVIKDFEDRMQYWRRKSKRILFPCGIGTFENYALLGRSVGASANGRLEREALAPNYSPRSGCDTEGPTAVFNSITKPELLRYYCGCPVDVSLNSNDFKGEVGIERIKGIIETFCLKGGQILTITSCNVNDLKDAKINPDKHKSLMVRLGGLSAYFIVIAPEQQDNIIRRFEKGV